MNALASALDEIVNEGKRGKDRDWGFVLMMFPVWRPLRALGNYISNGADRTDVVTLMKEMIARFEGQPEMGGNA